jgi:hypothetical protein
MSGLTLVDELKEYRNKLEVSVQNLGKLGRARASTEAEYRIALAQAILLHRAEGMPVTIIGDVCRGTPEIANMKQERDIAEALYQSCIEAINAYKLNIRIIEGQIAREWGYQDGA